MKKSIAVILIIIITLNIIATTAFAEVNGVDFGNSNETLDEMTQGSTANGINSLMGNGEAQSTMDPESTNTTGITQSTSVKENSGDFNAIGSITSIIFMLLPSVASWIMSSVVNNKITVSSDETFTIQNLLNNKYDIFDIDVFNTNTTGPNAQLINKIRLNVSIWFIAIRNIALVGTTIILVYIAIRMAIATIAEEKAKYKNMLIGWFIGFALIWIIHLIAIFLIRISNIFISIVSSLTFANIESVEKNIVVDSYSKILSTQGATSKIYYLLIYYFFIIYEVKFFIVYLIRELKIYFYIIISPLVCMTYSLDKIKDNRSQAFDRFIKELAIDIFMQPAELVIYTIFMASASEIVSRAPLLALALLYGLSKGEQTVRKLFGVDTKLNKGLERAKLSKIFKG